MNYSAVEFTLSTRSLDIYLSGCNGNPKCQGCHNPESWDFEAGKDIKESYSKIDFYIRDYNDLILNIFFFGGEPLDQNMNELLEFLKIIQKYIKKVWLFTRYELDEIPEEIKNKCDYIKTGRYLPELTVSDNIQFDIKLATSNQKIHKIK